MWSVLGLNQSRALDAENYAHEKARVALSRPEDQFQNAGGKKRLFNLSHKSAKLNLDTYT